MVLEQYGDFSCDGDADGAGNRDACRFGEAFETAAMLTPSP